MTKKWLFLILLFILTGFTACTENLGKNNKNYDQNCPASDATFRVLLLKKETMAFIQKKLKATYQKTGKRNIGQKIQ